MSENTVMFRLSKEDVSSFLSLMMKGDTPADTREAIAGIMAQDKTEMTKDAAKDLHLQVDKLAGREKAEKAAKKIKIGKPVARLIESIACRVFHAKPGDPRVTEFLNSEKGNALYLAINESFVKAFNKDEVSGEKTGENDSE